MCIRDSLKHEMISNGLVAEGDNAPANGGKDEFDFTKAQVNAYKKSLKKSLKRGRADTDDAGGARKRGRSAVVAAQYPNLENEIQDFMVHAGDWAQDRSLDSVRSRIRTLVEAVIIYVRENLPPTLRELMALSWEGTLLPALKAANRLPSTISDIKSAVSKFNSTYAGAGASSSAAAMDDDAAAP